MGAIKTFQDLLVWQKSHEFVLGVYSLTNTFPKHELYGLTSQLRRAAVSVPGNIAEGFKRHSKKEKLRFYNIADSSLEEAKYYLFLAKDLGYIDKIELYTLAEEAGRLLNGLTKSVQSSLCK